MIGVMTLLYYRKFGAKNIPLIVMTGGGFDLITNIQSGWLVYGMNERAFWLQLTMVLGGYILAGQPSFSIDRLFWVSGVVYGVTMLTDYYPLFELALFFYVYKSVEPHRAPWEVLSDWRKRKTLIEDPGSLK